MINEHRMFGIVDGDGKFFGRDGDRVIIVDECQYDFYIDDIIAIRDRVSTGNVSIAYSESSGSLSAHLLGKFLVANTFEGGGPLSMISRQGLKALIVPVGDYAGNLLRAPDGRNFCFSMIDSEEDHTVIHRVSFQDGYATMFTDHELVLLLRQALDYSRKEWAVIPGIAAMSSRDNPVDYTFHCLLAAATVMCEGYVDNHGHEVVGVNGLEVVSL